MAREFWEMFLPENINILAARWDGKAGTAEIKFCYPCSARVFCAKFVKNSNSINSDWHLSEIV